MARGHKLRRRIAGSDYDEHAESGSHYSDPVKTEHSDEQPSPRQQRIDACPHCDENGRVTSEVTGATGACGHRPIESDESGASP